MKKIVYIFCLIAMPLVCFAFDYVGYPICLQVHYINPSGTINQKPKSPAAPPTVYQEDNTLTFVADHPEYVLYIKDEDEEVVYSAVVTSAETEVMLPSYLSGTYEIELVMGNWLFTGWIDL